jgi:EmrB/QacA subfamily drug resistance transporter
VAAVEPGSRRSILVAFAGIMVVILLAALDQTIVATALPGIVADLRAFEDLSWIVTAYLVASTVTIPIYGRLGDIHGRRRMFVVAISIFVLGSLLCAVAQNVGQLVGARVVQGLGAGGLLPLAQAAVADLVPPRDRGRYQGFISGTWAVAAVAGPLLGGALTDSASWRWIFWLNVPLSVLALVVVLRTMRVPHVRREHAVDVPGAITLSIGVVCVLLACSWGGSRYPWGSPQVLGAAAAGVVALAAFVWIARRAAEPLLPLTLFRNRIFAVSSLGSVSWGALLFAVTVYVPLFVQGAQGSSATTSGAVLMPLLLAWTAVGVIAGQVISRTGRYRPFPIAGSALALAGTVLLTLLGPDSSALGVVIATGVMGAGMGMMVQAYIIATQNAVENAVVGTATAALQFFRSMGGSLAVAGLSALLAARLSTELSDRLGSAAARIDQDRLLEGGTAIPADLVDATQHALAASLHSVFLALVPIAALGLVAALRLEERPLRTRAASEPAPSSSAASRRPRAPRRPGAAGGRGASPDRR